MHDEPLWPQARLSSFLWLKCKPFWKLTGHWLTCKYPEENMKKLIIKRLCLLTLQLGSWPFLFRALCIHSSHCISLWLLSGQWQRRQSHTEPLLASSMNEWLIHIEPPLHAFNSSVSSTKQVTTSEGPWSTQQRLEPQCQDACFSEPSYHVLLNPRIRCRLWSVSSSSTGITSSSIKKEHE